MPDLDGEKDQLEAELVPLQNKHAHLVEAVNENVRRTAEILSRGKAEYDLQTKAGSSLSGFGDYTAHRSSNSVSNIRPLLI